jgi:nucleoid-associated protein YgaU
VAQATAPKGPTAPKVVHHDNGSVSVEAPKAPTAPKAPLIKIPMRPKAAPHAPEQLAAKPEVLKHEAPAHEAPKHEAPKHEAPKHELPKLAMGGHEAPALPAGKQANAKHELPGHAEAPKAALHGGEAPKALTVAAQPKHEAAHAAKHEAGHEAPTLEAPKVEAPKHEAAKHEVPAHVAALAPKHAMERPAMPIKPMAAPETAESAPKLDEGATVAVPKKVPLPKRAPMAEAPGGAQHAYYAVKAGDTLSALAHRYLGNANRWPEIYRANRATLANPHQLRIGQMLMVPKAELAHHKLRAGANYVVRPGDSLFRIASTQLGDGTHWHKIFQLNRGRIRDPRTIFPGQKLRLPL